MNHTAGLFLIDSNLNVLICEPNGGADQHGGYSVPKGLIDKKETYLEAAIRETKEECGFDATSYQKKIKDVGEQKYTGRNKIFHGFLLKLDFELNSDRMVCTSYIKDDISRPEITGFEVVTIDEAIDKLHKVQRKVLKRIKKNMLK